MKILLTTMPTEGQFVDWTTPSYYQPNGTKYMPLGILSLATNLHEDYEKVVFDPSSEGWSIEETISRIEEEKPDILGLSVVTQRVWAMNEILKKTSAPYKVVGGPHATHYANQILEDGADAVFVGGLADAEFREAVKDLPRGVIYCRTDIQSVKFPDRSFLKIAHYFSKSSVLFETQNRLPMYTSIGCPHHCIFCDVQIKRQQRKPPEIIVTEMQYLYSIGCRSIHILDDNFNLDETYIWGILREMDRRRFSIELSGRGQAKISEELAEGLADHNFRRFHIGIEALSDDVLKFLRKSTRTQGIYKFCRNANKNNIDIIAYFILGTPIETDKYLKWLPIKIEELGIRHPYFNILFPSPNTEYYRQLLRDGLYSKDHWAEYMRNPTPDFQLPYPYGEKRHQKTVAYVDGLIKEFGRN